MENVIFGAPYSRVPKKIQKRLYHCLRFVKFISFLYLNSECKRDVILLLDSKFNRNANTKAFLNTLFNNTKTIGANGIQIALAYYDTQVHSIWELNT
jgi:hypothetical protein